MRTMFLLSRVLILLCSPHRASLTSISSLKVRSLPCLCNMIGYYDRCVLCADWSTNLECGMLLLLQLDYNITGLLSWLLVSLTIKNFPEVTRSTLVNLDLNDFLVLCCLLSLACFASLAWWNHLSSSLTLSTYLLALISSWVGFS